MAVRVLPQRPLTTQQGRPDPLWDRFFRSLIDVPQWLGIEDRADQAAAIAATPIVVVGRLQSGIYRISYYTRITQAATTSSSLTIVFNWTDGGVAQQVVGAALVGNTTTTLQQDRLMVRVDRNTSITYETAYASVGATPMQYRLHIALERLAMVVLSIGGVAGWWLGPWV